jgi:small subunit ribosomal protein S17
MKTWIGIVKSRSNEKTVMVCVESYTKHPKYQKYIRKRYVYPAHDELNCLVGEKVRLKEVPPISKCKSKLILERISI